MLLFYLQRKVFQKLNALVMDLAGNNLVFEILIKKRIHIYKKKQ